MPELFGEAKGQWRQMLAADGYSNAAAFMVRWF
jgi:hypothetical protein